MFAPRKDRAVLARPYPTPKKAQRDSCCCGKAGCAGEENTFDASCGQRELLRFLSDVLGDLRRKIRLNELTLHVRFGAGDDAAKTAIRYGRAWALIGMVMPHMERIFVIKKRDIGAELDYNEKENMRVDAHLLTTITVGRALALLVYAGVRYLKMTNGMKKGGAGHESSPE